MSRDHRTDACDHECRDNCGKTLWCVHCEEGCQNCGSLDELSDSGYCPACRQSRAEALGDQLYERMKYGEE